MQVLVALYRAKGGVVSRDALIAGHWPDFCADPDFPYKCKAEANRLSAAK
jgi:hypothetical protein